MDSRRRYLIANAIKGGELPSGYTRLNYLETTADNNSPYIDTGIVPDSNTGFKVKVAITGNLQYDHYIFGCRNTYGDDRYLIGAYQGYIYLGFGKTLSDAQHWTPQLNEIFEISLNFNNEKKGYYNGEYPVNTKQDTLPVMSVPIGIFKSLGSFYNGPTQHKCYDVQISKSGIVIRHFIPALDPNNIPCMYDTVTKQPFYNAGSGEFLYG